jgi:hypothetical protein
VHFSETTLSSHAGAVPLLQFLNERLKLPQLLGIAVPTTGRARRYPAHLVLYAFLVGSLLGVANVAHLEWLRDPASLRRRADRVAGLRVNGEVVGAVVHGAFVQ